MNIDGVHWFRWVCPISQTQFGQTAYGQSPQALWLLGSLGSRALEPDAFAFGGAMASLAENADWCLALCLGPMLGVRLGQPRRPHPPVMDFQLGQKKQNFSGK